MFEFIDAFSTLELTLLGSTAVLAFIGLRALNREKDGALKLTRLLGSIAAGVLKVTPTPTGFEVKGKLMTLQQLKGDIKP